MLAKNTLLVVTASFALLTASTPIAQAADVDETPVIVELFTSQGCSSCPSADRVLIGIDSRAKSNDEAIYTLSFHVDYWNRLGWTDPYSSELFSHRQRAYARARNSTRVYTPQMIVNGTTEFVGSHSKKAIAAIDAARQRPASSSVTVDVDKIHSDVVTLNYTVSGNSSGDVLNLAVFHTPKKNRVPRGENSGRELSHVNVVRSFKVQKLDRSTGQVEIELPKGIDIADLKVAAYVQNLKRLEITGAAVLALPSA